MAWAYATKFADALPMFKREIQIVNNVVNVYYSCLSFGQMAATVNFGRPTEDTGSIARVYGIVSRYQAYVNALFVLDNYRPFPYAQGQEEVPEGFERRRV